MGFKKNIWIKSRVLGLIVFLSVITSTYLSGQCIWNGTTGNWSDVSKWSCGHVPTLADDVTVNNNILLDIPAESNKFTFYGGTISGTNNISVNGDFVLYGSNCLLGNTGDLNVVGNMTTIPAGYTSTSRQRNRHCNWKYQHFRCCNYECTNFN